MRSIYVLLPHFPQQAWLRSHTYNTNGTEPAKANALVTAWHAASAAEKVAFATTIGVGVIWDECLVPAL